MVIGHELGHQQHRHSLKAIGRNLLYAGALMLVFGDDYGAFFDVALDLADLAHSREQELEADAYGLRLVHRRYGHTKGSLEFFEKLAENAATRGSKLASMLSTHPYTPERLERLKRLAKKLEARKN
jgi:Zn-dependent protease with chaperone function